MSDSEKRIALLIDADNAPAEMIDEILTRHTGQPLEIIRRDSDRDFFMDAQEAKDYGLVDEILRRGAVKS